MRDLVEIELEKAVELLIKKSGIVEEIVEIDLLNSLGYILGEDIVSEINNPPFDRSPLDGFTFNNIVTKEATKDRPVVLKVESEIMAGEYLEKISSEKTGVRVMTGAPIPSGCNAVVRQEDVIYDEKTKELKIFRKFKKYENFCFKGEDFKRGDTLLKAGEKITANHIGVIASMGKASIKVIRKPLVGLLCTGDEIVFPGSSLTSGKIYNSNLYSLASRLKSIGVDVRIYPPVKDEIQEMVELLKKEMSKVDLMITTGGVSVGKKDILHEVIQELPSQRIFWKVNMQPGTPVLASSYKGKLILSLSGNPFACITNYELLVKPILHKLSKGMVQKNRSVRGILKENFGKASKRRRFVRARYEDGRVSFNTDKHSSGQLSSIIGKNALIDIKAGSPKLKAGDCVEVLIVGE